jgi:hypothetical protein
MRIYITALMLAVTLVLTSCGGGNQSSSTGSSVTAQATTATVLACNASASFGGAGPLLTETSNPTLEACNAAIAFTCNASTTFGGTESALTDVTSPSIKTCLAVMNESNSNGGKVLAGQMTVGGSVTYYTQNFGGGSYGAFLGNSSYPCAFASSSNVAIASCLKSSVNQFAFYYINGDTYGDTYYSQNFGGNTYGVFPKTGYYPCGYGSTPNQAMVSCLN